MGTCSLPWGPRCACRKLGSSLVSLTGRLSLLAVVMSLSFARAAPVANALRVALVFAPSRAVWAMRRNGLATDCLAAMSACQCLVSHGAAKARACP